MKMNMKDVRNKNIFSSKNWIEKSWQGNKLLPKFRQTGLLTLNNQQFKKDILMLRKKWGNELKREKELLNKMISALEKEGFYKNWNSKSIKKVELSKIILEKVEKKFPLKRLDQRLYGPDIVKLCQKYNLPFDLWGQNMFDCFDTGSLLPPVGNLNFGIHTDINSVEFAMREPALFIQIYPNTTINDIKRGWRRIKWEQNELGQKQSPKRYYPFKYLPDAIKILKTKKDKCLDFDYALRKDVLVRETDSSIASEIFGEEIVDEIGEGKAINRVKQLRHRYKRLLE